MIEHPTKVDVYNSIFYFLHFSNLIRTNFHSLGQIWVDFNSNVCNLSPLSWKVEIIMGPGNEPIIVRSTFMSLGLWKPK